MIWKGTTSHRAMTWASQPAMESLPTGSGCEVGPPHPLPGSSTKNAPSERYAPVSSPSPPGTQPRPVRHSFALSPPTALPGPSPGESPMPAPFPDPPPPRLEDPPPSGSCVSSGSATRPREGCEKLIAAPRSAGEASPSAVPRKTLALRPAPACSRGEFMPPVGTPAASARLPSGPTRVADPLTRVGLRKFPPAPGQRRSPRRRMIVPRGVEMRTVSSRFFTDLPVVSSGC